MLTKLLSRVSLKTENTRSIHLSAVQFDKLLKEPFVPVFQYAKPGNKRNNTKDRLYVSL
jgi:hypothetical protein